MKQAINSKTTLFNPVSMAILVTAGAGLSLSAQAATVTGNIGVTIELGSGCQINGHAGQTQPLDFGDIDFDEWMSLSTNSPNIDANTSGSAGGEYNGDQSNRHQRMSAQFIQRHNGCCTWCT